MIAATQQLASFCDAITIRMQIERIEWSSLEADKIHGYRDRMIF